MSHELRTPLNAIIGFSELLEDQFQEKLDKSQKEYVQDINKSGKHLLSIITDLLDLSKIEADKMVLKLTDVHLPMLLDNSLSMFKESVLKHRIRLSADVRGCPETIKADELRLKQIIYNILSNAVKFTPDGGEVILAARLLTHSDHQWLTENGEVASLPASVSDELTHRDRVVDIVVTDTGIGIKKEDLTRIFKPFEQADGSLSRQYQGTGLGLSLARRFTELHGGCLYAASEGENRGSSFHCLIPTDHESR
jgi:signal transduction histidine kinase